MITTSIHRKITGISVYAKLPVTHPIFSGAWYLCLIIGGVSIDLLSRMKFNAAVSFRLVFRQIVSTFQSHEEY